MQHVVSSGLTLGMLLFTFQCPSCRPKQCHSPTPCPEAQQLKQPTSPVVLSAQQSPATLCTYSLGSLIQVPLQNSCPPPVVLAPTCMNSATNDAPNP